ncbi:sigma-54-dependent transcriptional regulator [Singulisphaera acidiphila]|uniref:Response regulator with CheY-like receiver, AAA-type ATPase, and DNA-binding domains n=1 Tax=Singulisphaera acidiphila (strain ATCC BAA-1392 / DSM 18658 / VKM B-2454 / MOB10) TaxID=886293 RepID=L0DPT8_SINAD|nr:sigma-54 dependent transcriptional regulator [Singulisphaera acidiphila]AGA30845.1 response regulator with CheY-like receiver, AAA-type ATPase, and DNA-binding domains [Singulisphaera acidiphila DSM 18658]
MKRRILVVDDTPLIREHLRVILEMDGFEVETASDGRTALACVRERVFHLVITDLRMPDMSGIELLTAVRAEKLPFGVIVLTGHGDTQVALDVMKAGADDFVTKPYEPDHLRFLVQRILERRRLIDELQQLRMQMREDYSFHNMVSKSPKMRKVFDLIKQVGPLGSTVLVYGETGTGKELVAQAIHAADTRRQGPFVALNCAVLHDSLLESELFGHERGSFTGADKRKKGRFEYADNGTLFLDEVGDVSPAMQAKLLRVLQSGTFERVGGTETLKVDVRIVAASNKRLEEEVKAGRFRSDLFYRLNVIRVDLPALRERPEDIPLLAMYFLEKFKPMSTPPVTEIDSEAMQALIDHTWPGHVRELENAIKAAVAMADGSVIHRDALPPAVAPRARKPINTSPLIDIERPLPDLTNDLIGRVERDYFVRLLAQYRGNVARCAKHSGLSRRSVTQKLQKYELDRTRFKDAAFVEPVEG